MKAVPETFCQGTVPILSKFATAHNCGDVQKVTDHDMNAPISMDGI